MITIERELKNEIMATDLYLCVSSDSYDKNDIEKDIEYCVATLKDFEVKYSRFIRDNDLSEFNSKNKITISKEFIDILAKSKYYFEITDGLFDITIIKYLRNEGYVKSKNSGYFDTQSYINIPNKSSFSALDIKLNMENYEATKPSGLEVDLGGIGKGYIVDELSKYLKLKYKDFCISLGGDMYLGGADVINNYKNWAIEVENPLDMNNKDIEMPVLLLSDMAVATSGVNKRKWQINDEMKNHIIDPRNGKSLITDLQTVTVIGNSTVFCDVMAKTLLIKGLSEGMEFCDNNKIPAIFIDKEIKVYQSLLSEKYIWKENNA